MKKEITMKYIKNNYKNIIKTGYCDIQHLTKGLEPTYYNDLKNYCDEIVKGIKDND